MTTNETMEERFDERFGDNYVWWQECLAEMRIGDPDFKSLKAFILSEIYRAQSEMLKKLMDISEKPDLDGVNHIVVETSKFRVFAKEQGIDLSIKK